MRMCVSLLSSRGSTPALCIFFPHRHSGDLSWPETDTHSSAYMGYLIGRVIRPVLLQRTNRTFVQRYGPTRLLILVK